MGVDIRTAQETFKLKLERLQAAAQRLDAAERELNEAMLAFAPGEPVEWIHNARGHLQIGTVRRHRYQALIAENHYTGREVEVRPSQLIDLLKRHFQ